MNTPSETPRRSSLRTVWRFVLFGTVLCLSPFLILAVVALSYLGLRSDAAILRREVFAATPAGWSTKVQFNLGESTLGAVGLGLGFVHDEHMTTARHALAGIKRASVGVYERRVPLADWSRARLFSQADQMMEKHGWKRLAGINDHASTVLIYGPSKNNDGQSVEVCLAVINEKNLVIASAKLDSDAITELIRAEGFERLGSHRFSLAQN